MSLKKMPLFLIVGAVALAMVGCKKESKPEPGTAPPAVAPTKAPATKATGPGAGLSGKVIQTMDSGGYTYAELETGKGKLWAAVRQTELKQGQDVTVLGATLMRGFKSKTLDRTFDEIYFGQLKGGAGAAAAGEGAMGGAAKMPAGHPPSDKVHGVQAGAKAGMVHGQGATGDAKRPPGAQKQPQMDVGDALEKAAGPDGRTVAEIFAQGKDLKDKQVTVRGKVVKINRGIMGRNWVHLQDGSGSVDKGDHDLTVTTKGDAKLGEVLLVKGTLRTDKDFGAGYKYAVMLEDAEFTR